MREHIYTSFSSINIFEVYSNLNYLRVTTAPTSSNCFLRASASSLETPSLITLGAPSTASLASLSPKPVASLTALITLTF